MTTPRNKNVNTPSASKNAVGEVVARVEIVTNFGNFYVSLFSNNDTHALLAKHLGKDVTAGFIDSIESINVVAPSTPKPIDSDIASRIAGLA